MGRLLVSDFYKPFPKQLEFHNHPAVYRLFGGAAGPGKSKALLMEAVKQAHLWPGVNTLLMRRTFPELEQSLLLEFRRTIPTSMYESFNESKHVVTWRNGSVTRFGYASNERDIEQYQGAEYLFIGIDELTKFTLYQWQFLTSRNRCSVPGSFACMAGATNPGGIGHKWVKAHFIDKDFRDETYDPSEYVWVPAYLRDNPIYANDLAYQKKLGTLPKHLRDAFLLGDWNLLSGQYFDVWQEATLVAPQQELGMRRWWTRWIAVDWGFDHPSVVYWFARSETGQIVQYREFAMNRLTPRMLGEAIVERSIRNDDDCSGGDGGQEKIAAVFLSPDAFASRTGESTIAEQLGSVLSRGGLPRPTPAENDRVGGWMLMYQLMASGSYRVAAECERFIECIPSLIRDDKKPEDVMKVNWDGVNLASGDDPADAARYGLYSMLKGMRKPLEERVSDRIAAIEQARRETTGTPLDPTARAMVAQKAEADERKKDRPIPLLNRGRFGRPRRRF